VDGSSGAMAGKVRPAHREEVNLGELEMVRRCEGGEGLGFRGLKEGIKRGGGAGGSQAGGG
jgi:hypothetical protein